MQNNTIEISSELLAECPTLRKEMIKSTRENLIKMGDDVFSLEKCERIIEDLLVKEGLIVKKL